MLGPACGRESDLPGTSAGGPGPARSPAVPYPSRGLVAYSGAVTASELSREAGSETGSGKSTAAEPAPGTPCPGPLSAGWRRAEVAVALEPSRATCAQAVGPGRARIRETIHSGFQTPGPVPGDRARR